jgi:hypothetical protein
MIWRRLEAKVQKCFCKFLTRVASTVGNNEDQVFLCVVVTTPVSLCSGFNLADDLALLMDSKHTFFPVGSPQISSGSLSFEHS